MYNIQSTTNKANQLRVGMSFRSSIKYFMRLFIRKAIDEDHNQQQLL